jgi:hypothetical protein
MNTKISSTAGLIREFTETVQLGEPFITAELLKFGTRVAVDHSLSRLVREGVIMRVTRGVYVRPIINEYVGPVTPAPYEIAKAVARSTGAQISMNGAEAARRLELSTQMSTQSLYQTTGSTRSIQVGKSKIRLRHASPRKLALAGRPVGMALSALYYLGKEEVTPTVIEKIRAKLAPSEFQELCGSIEIMPSWMGDVFHEFASQERQLIA